MTAICFVCNLPIMSHQVGLGNITRESSLQIIYLYISFLLPLLRSQCGVEAMDGMT